MRTKRGRYSSSQLGANCTLSGRTSNRADGGLRLELFEALPPTRMTCAKQTAGGSRTEIDIWQTPGSFCTVSAACNVQCKMKKT